MELNNEGAASPQMISDAMSTVGMDDAEKEARLAEEAAVRKFFQQFDDDQKFDKPIRQQIRKDRSYASGEAQSQAPVNTNMIGSAIDVLTSSLYARDPDVSVRPAPQVDPPPDPLTGVVPPQPERQRNQDMAKSLELVLSTLWKKGKLKPRMRRVIRSILSATHGWLKVLPVSQVMPDPLAQNEYNTLQDNVASVAAQLRAIEAGQTLDGQSADHDALMAQKQQLEASMEALSQRLEVDTCYGFTFDVVKPENMQVGTDVELLEEYLDADSLTESMYVPVDELSTKFPGLTKEDLAQVQKYYRKQPTNANKGEAAPQGTNMSWLMGMYPNASYDDELYTQTDQHDGSRAFARVLEKWCRVDNHIYTAISGVKVWARKPYQPSWASSRFYPYFYFSLNEVDGQRCPQSLSSRGAKLQDEYASVRSAQRITRQRSIPGTLADATAFSDEELQKLKEGVIAEVIPMTATVPGTDFNKAFTAKPVPSIDMRLYDTTSIVMDLERTFGVQEAQQQTTNIEKTATEAEIQQSGFNTRTSTWRDTIETALTDMAQYCAEVALQKIPPHIAAKIAGPAVYWPHGLALEDITSLVEVSISAGTTGKPRNMGDREAWGVILPQLVQNIEKVAMLEANPATAHIAVPIKETIRETARRFNDEGDLSRFLPAAPTVQPPLGAPAPLPGEAPMGEPLPADPAAPAPPTEAIDPMQQGMENNGFFGTP